MSFSEISSKVRLSPAVRSLMSEENYLEDSACPYKPFAQVGEYVIPQKMAGQEEIFAVSWAGKKNGDSGDQPLSIHRLQANSFPDFMLEDNSGARKVPGSAERLSIKEEAQEASRVFEIASEVKSIPFEPYQSKLQSVQNKAFQMHTGLSLAMPSKDLSERQFTNSDKESNELESAAPFERIPRHSLSFWNSSYTSVLFGVPSKKHIKPLLPGQEGIGHV